jgi:hypothetical protein
MKTLLSLVLIFGVLLSAGLVIAGPNASAVLELNCRNAQSLDVQALDCVRDGRLQIRVEAINVVDLDSYDFKLIYDRDYFEIIPGNVEEGPFLKSLGGTTFFQKDLSEPGLAWLSGSLAGKNRAMAPDGEGTLVLLEFAILQPLESGRFISDMFQIKDAVLWDSEIVEDRLK